MRCLPSPTRTSARSRRATSRARCRRPWSGTWPPGGVFYDIGANLGFFALLGAHLAGLEPGACTRSRPAPDNAEAIRRNAALNGMPNMT